MKGIVGSGLAFFLFIVITAVAGWAIEKAQERVDLERMVFICYWYLSAIAVLTLMVAVRTPSRGF